MPEKLLRPSEIFRTEQIRDAYRDMLQTARRTLRNLHYQAPTFGTSDLTHETVAALLASVSDKPMEVKDLLNVFARKANFVLIDHIRRKTRRKRDPGQAPVAFDDLQAEIEKGQSMTTFQEAPEVFLLVERLLRLLESSEEFPRTNRILVQTVRLRYDYGLSNLEIAQLLGKPEATIKRYLRQALEWMRERMAPKDQSS